MSNWNTTNIPSQVGKLAVITGATGGLGYETALALAQAGAEVIVAGRNDSKGRDAIEKIRAGSPNASIRFEKIDLANLASVADFAGRLTAQYSTLDMLINNAGVMSVPTRRTTDDGFELQFGTNYLGHFALTAHLLPLLHQTTEPRVVNLSSSVHNIGKINFDDLQAEKSYSPWGAYAQSKLAMLMFAFELQRRSAATGWGIMSNAAHPGWARTDLVANGPQSGGNKGIVDRLMKVVAPLFSQNAAAGSLPTLYAATSPRAHGGAYYGPDGFFEIKGAPTIASIASQAKDTIVAARLWTVSEELTGVRFALPVAVA